jgi:5,10-methylenetetrahydromethanopterin reductase
MRLSFQVLPEQPASELLDAIAAADRLGYYACYSADEIYHKDAWLLFAAAAERTERIRLGPCVAPIYMREPTYIAQLAATLDELSGGRAEVVFGIGNIAMLEQYGVEWRGTRPIARLREAHQVMRTVLDEGAIDFEGDFYRYTCVTTASHPVQEHLPLKIGAMGGPKSMELAGEIADGLHTACAYSPEALGYAVEHFQAGVERAGRNPDGLDRGDSLLGAIAPDGDVARRAGRILAAFISRRCPRRSSSGMGSSWKGWRQSPKHLPQARFSARSKPLRRTSPTRSWSPVRPRTGCGGSLTPTPRQASITRSSRSRIRSR